MHFSFPFVCKALTLQQRSIMCKHKDRLLHVSLLKASYLFFPENYVNKTLQSKPRNGDSIWWVIEPHWHFLSTLFHISFKPFIKINFIFTISNLAQAISLKKGCNSNCISKIVWYTSERFLCFLNLISFIVNVILVCFSNSHFVISTFWIPHLVFKLIINSFFHFGWCKFIQERCYNHNYIS